MLNFDQRVLFEFVKQRVRNCKGPKRDGWYRGGCPFPGHEGSTTSFAFSMNGYNCFGCGRKGPLRTIASASASVTEQTQNPSGIARTTRALTASAARKRPPR